MKSSSGNSYTLILEFFTLAAEAALKTFLQNLCFFANASGHPPQIKSVKDDLQLRSTCLLTA